MNKIKVINLYQYGGASNPQYNTRSRTTDDTVDFTPKKKNLEEEEDLKINSI